MKIVSVTSESEPTSPSADLPKLLQKSVETFGISTEITNVDMLLAGEASRHFPEPRNRRKQDSDDADIQRLRSILDALDRGAGLPADAIDAVSAPVHSQFYRQF